MIARSWLAPPMTGVARSTGLAEDTDWSDLDPLRAIGTVQRDLQLTVGRGARRDRLIRT